MIKVNRKKITYSKDVYVLRIEISHDLIAYAEELRQIIFKAIKTHEAKLGRKDKYGQRYTIDFTLKWQNKSAIIRTGWIIENNSKIPRLTTCYPL